LVKLSKLIKVIKWIPPPRVTSYPSPRNTPFLAPPSALLS